MAYIGKSPDGTGVRSRFYYTQSSGGGTSVSGPSDDGTSLAFSDGAYVDVFLNGVLLVAGTDYNTSTANTIAGLAALANGDVVEVVVYDIFTVADTVSSLNGGTFSGAVGFSGGITGDVSFDTNTLVVDSANNRVGIGTTSPQSNINSSTKVLHLKQDSTNGSGVVMESSNCITEIIAGNDASYFYNFTSDPMIFGTNNTERMRLVNQNGGDLNFGGMSTFSFGNTETQINKFQINSGRNTTSARTHMAFGNPNGQVGSITTNGSSTAFETSSDHRLKQGVEDMTGAIDRVKALAPKRFQFIADADTTVDGFLAHEAQAVVPEAVSGTKDEVDDDGNAVMQGIDQAKLVPLLTAALKEAIAKIETLETKVAALEAAE